MTLEGESRSALEGAKWVFSVSVPRNAVLEFSMAVAGTPPGPAVSDTEFLIEVEEGGRQRRAFRRGDSRRPR